jgi:hypothetical protein
MLERILLHALLQFSRSRCMGFQPGHQIVAHRGQQFGIDFFMTKKKGCPSMAVIQ